MIDALSWNPLCKTLRSDKIKARGQGRGKRFLELSRRDRAILFDAKNRFVRCGDATIASDEFFRAHTSPRKSLRKAVKITLTIASSFARITKRNLTTLSKRRTRVSFLRDKREPRPSTTPQQSLDLSNFPRSCRHACPLRRFVKRGKRTKQFLAISKRFDFS